MILKKWHSKLIITFIIVILFLTLLPINNAIEVQVEAINPPIPGCMNGEYPIFEFNYDYQAPQDVIEQVEINIKYSGYIDKAIKEA